MTTDTKRMAGLLAAALLAASALAPAMAQTAGGAGDTTMAADDRDDDGFDWGLLGLLGLLGLIPRKRDTHHVDTRPRT